MEAFEGEAGLPNFSEKGGDRFGIHSELLGAAAHFHTGTFELEVGVDTYSDASPPASSLLDGGQFGDFAKGFDVDQNAGGNGASQLFGTLSGACEADVAGVGTTIEGHLEFVGRSNVDAIDPFCHIVDDGRHRIGLHCVVDLDFGG